MKIALVSLAAVPLAYAHTHITNLFVNGVDQGDLMCLRAPNDAATLTFPVEDLNSPAMACGTGGTTGVGRVCPVPDGATLTFKYHIAPNDPTSGGIAYSHVGPCAVYLKKVEDAIYDGAAGDGWFKLWDMGYTDQWCTIKVNEAGGLLTVNLPKGLVGGYYLVRPELLALHQAKDGNPQYYVSCAQVYVQSSGDLVPKGTVSIPGYCTVADAANSFNVYDGTPPSSYKCGGPAPVALVNGGFNNGNTPIVNGGFNNGNTPMDKGGRPKGCILEIGSWCGKEVPSYSDQQGCWVAQENCWNQECWKNTPAAMQKDCDIWKAKCEDLAVQCASGNWYGPPNAGKDLTPPKATIQVPPPPGPTRAPDANPPKYYNAYQAAPPTYNQAPPPPPSYEQAPPPPPPTYEQPPPPPQYKAPAPPQPPAETKTTVKTYKLVCWGRGKCGKVEVVKPES